MLRRAMVTNLCAVLAAGAVACGDKDFGGAPDVRGLSLPDAKRELKRQGFGASETSDAAFGVIVPENFTVCDQETPKGKLVPLEVSKTC